MHLTYQLQNSDMEPRDRPVDDDWRSDQKLREAYDRAVAILTKSAKRFQYPTVPDGALVEQYAQAKLEIACVLDWPHAVGERGVFMREDESAAFRVPHHGDGVSELIQRDQGRLVSQVQRELSRDKQVVLVRNVERVKVVEGEFASGKGGQFTEDVVKNGTGRNVWGLSLDGSFRAWPVLSKGEKGPPGDSPAIVLDHDAVRVVEARSEVVDNIPDDQGCFLWDRKAHQAFKLPRIWVHFALHGLDVGFDVGEKGGFQLADVMIGPFYFEKGASH